MDYLVLGTCLLEKSKMPKELLKGREQYLQSFRSD
jgi:hypothetical protein